MKKVKREDAAGLQEWLSYQSRTRAVVQPESDVIDWDEGIEVQEEWLPRELCEQRLREETERKLVPAGGKAMVASATPVVEIEDVPLTPAAVLDSAAGNTLVGRPAAPASDSVAEPRAPDATISTARPREAATPAESSAREVGVREAKSRLPMPAQLETGDLANALPAFDY